MNQYYMICPRNIVIKLRCTGNLKNIQPRQKGPHFAGVFSYKSEDIDVYCLQSVGYTIQLREYLDYDKYKNYKNYMPIVPKELME